MVGIPKYAPAFHDAPRPPLMLISVDIFYIAGIGVALTLPVEGGVTPKVGDMDLPGQDRRLVHVTSPR